MRRYLSLSLIALVASLALALGSGGPPANAASCTSTQNQAFVNIKSTIVWNHYRETYTGGGAPTISGKTTLVNAIAGKITYTFCVGKSSTGVWTIKSAPAVVENSYYKLDSHLNADGTGFALRATYVNAKTLTVEPVMCAHDGRLDFLKWVASLPIPGLNYVASVGQYIVSSLVPTGGTKCEAFSDESIPITFRSTNGATTAGTVSHNFYTKTPISTGICATPPNSCNDVLEYRWVISPQ